MKYEYHKLAGAELEESAAWYDRQSSGLSADFVQEVDRAIERILAGPDTFAFYEGRVRSCPVQ